MSNPKIIQLELTNFKSFQGSHVIGPFNRYSCLIGPNGAGKSNALDAILFALFLDLNPRTTNYIHKNLLTDQYVSDSCEVTVRLEVEDEPVSFKRIFYQELDDDQNHREEYFKDDSSLDRETYIEEIRKLHILPLAVIKQTEVDSVARYTPMELTKLFEEMSGSVEYAEDYDKFKLESESRREAVVLLEKRKRVAMSEQRHISFRKTEADQYLYCSQKEQELIRESALFQLYHAKHQLDTAREEVMALEANKEEFSKGSSDLNSEILEQQKIVNRRHNGLAGVEKEFEDVEQGLRDAKKERSMAEATASFHTEHIQSGEAKLSQNAVAAEQQQKREERWSEELEQLQNELETLPVVENLEAQIEEYNRIRQGGSAKTGAVEAELGKCVRTRDEVARRLHEAEASIRLQRETDARLHEELEAAKRADEQAKTELEAMSTEAGALGAELRGLTEKADALGREQERLFEARREASQRVEEARRSRGLSRREERTQQAIKTMQKLYPGVYGQFSKLVKPSHPRYETALAVACGGFRDAVIVKDSGTAQKCLEYLRDQSIGTMTFIPNDSVILSKPEHLPRGVKLLSQFVTPADPAYRNSIDFVCGDFAFCRDLNEAMALIFGKGKSAGLGAAVTEKGEIVRTSGEMQGGSEGQRTEWSAETAEELGRKLEEIEGKLGEIATRLIDTRSQLEPLSDRKEVLDTRLQTQKSKKQQCANRIKSLETDIRISDRAMKAADQTRKSVEEELKRAEEAIKAVDLERGQIDKQIFQEFCKKYNVEDVREFEVARLQPFEERYARRFELQSRISQLKSLLTGSKGLNPEQTLEQNRKELEEHKQEYQKAQKQLDKLNKQIEKLEKEKEALREKKDIAAGEYQSEAAVLAEKKKEYQKLTNDIADTIERNSEQQILIEEIRVKIRRIIQQVHMQGIELPYKKDYSPNMTNIGGTFTQEDSATTEIDHINFSELSPAQRSSNIDVEKTIKEYEVKIAEKRSQMAGLKPDLKSEERFTNVQDEIKGIEEKKKELSEQAKAAKRAFNEKKQKRTDAFMNLYNAIDQTINPIYKSLTKLRKNDRAGTAYLALEDTEEPYLGGIKFTAMPPHKPFRDLEQLSGGEKAIASLALIIALQKQVGAPFILMDEPDSSLDKENLRQAAIALRESTMEEDGAQIIAVSLRHRFFEYAERLFGIYRDVSGSGVASLDLEQFYEENLVMEKIE